MNHKSKRKNKGKFKETRRNRRNLKGGDTKARAIIWRKKPGSEVTDSNPNEYDYAFIVDDNPKNVQDAFRRSINSAEYFIDRSFEMKGPIPSGVRPYVKTLNIKFGSPAEDISNDNAVKKKQIEEDEKFAANLEVEQLTEEMVASPDKIKTEAIKELTNLIANKSILKKKLQKYCKDEKLTESGTNTDLQDRLVDYYSRKSTNEIIDFIEKLKLDIREYTKKKNKG